jgi:hypothetical protein
LGSGSSSNATRGTEDARPNAPSLRPKAAMGIPLLGECYCAGLARWLNYSPDRRLPILSICDGLAHLERRNYAFAVNLKLSIC